MGGGKGGGEEKIHTLPYQRGLSNHSWTPLYSSQSILLVLVIGITDTAVARIQVVRNVNDIPSGENNLIVGCRNSPLGPLVRLLLDPLPYDGVVVLPDERLRDLYGVEDLVALSPENLVRELQRRLRFLQLRKLRLTQDEGVEELRHVIDLLYFTLRGCCFFLICCACIEYVGSNL